MTIIRQKMSKIIIRPIISSNQIHPLKYSYYRQIMEATTCRKGSQDASENEEDNESMFPRLAAMSDLRQSIILLTEHYNKQVHSFSLINYCFRCHTPEFVDAYSQFRSINHPDLSQPRISNLYQNSAFPDLIQLGKLMKNESYEISGPHIGPIPKTLLQILNSLFMNYGYIPNFQRFLLFFPTYFQKHILVEKSLFHSQKIDSILAFFLGVIAAAEMGCAYVMARMAKSFLREGGSLDWLAGKYPPKIKMILQLNRLIARAPWEINAEHIEKILQNNSTRWSKNQLANCIQIMAFSQQMSTIALGMGLCPEDPSTMKLLNLQLIVELKQTYDYKMHNSSLQPKQKLATMIPVIRQFDEEESQSNLQVKPMTKKMLKKSMRRSENIDNYMKEIGNELTLQDMYHQINKWVQPLLPPYQPIQKRGESRNNVLDYSQYNYKFMAYPILHNLTDVAADKIQNLIAYSEIMTRCNFGNEKMNHTKEFRKAVRYYAQNLCGYTHQQYDFKSNVGAFLTMALKFYIRLLAMSPLHISRQVVRQTNHESGQIECFDLGHLAILIANTRMSLSLTMAIQAFELCTQN